MPGNTELQQEHTEIMEAIGKIDSKVEGVNSKVENVRYDLEFHIAQGHAEQNQLDILADVVLGKKYINYDGEVERRGGMKAMVEAYEDDGLIVRVPWGKISGIIATAVTAAGGILVAVIQRM